MDLFRDPECLKKIEVKGTVFDTTIGAIHEHMDESRTLHYMHEGKCEKATFSAQSFKLTHENNVEHACKSTTSTLSECMAGDRSDEFKEKTAARHAMFDLIRNAKKSIMPPVDASVDFSAFRTL